MMTLDTAARSRPAADRTAADAPASGSPAPSGPLGYRLRRAVQAWEAAFLKETEGTVTAAQGMILDAIDRHQPCTQTKLVSATGIDRSTLADVVRRLVKAKLVTRKRRRDDTRAYDVTLTPKGEMALNLARKAAKAVDKAEGASLLAAIAS